MATTKNGINYPDDYKEVADVPSDFKKLAESVDKLIDDLSDNKVDKIDGKGLSTNDFTNEDKSKLDSLENYDDSKIKQDISEIQQEQEKQNDNIESIQKVDEKQDELIQKLKDNSINITTEEATSLHIEDASELPAALDVRGNHKQEVIEGIQILEDTNKGTTGYTFSTSPENLGILEEVNYLGTRACKFSLTENPSNWKFINRKIDLSKLKNNTTYTIQLDVKTNYSETMHIRVQDTSSQNKLIDFGTISVNGEKQIKLIGTSNTTEILNQVLYIVADNIGNSTERELIITNLILIEGDFSNKDLKWEDYTNLEGSPSLDYPSYLKSIKENLEIVISNKNMAKVDNINKSINSNGVTVNIDDNGIVTLNGTATANFYINLYNLIASANSGYRLPKEKYKILFEVLEKNNSQISESSADISFYCRNIAIPTEEIKPIPYADFTRIVSTQNGVSIKEMEITQDTIVTYLYVSKGVILDNLKIRFAIFNENETNTTYVKHEELYYTLPIQEEMFKGDYFDLNKGKEVHHFKSYATKSTDNWILTPDSANRFRFDNSNISNTSLNNKNQYCSHSKLCYDWATQYESFQSRKGSFYFRTKRFSTAEEFNQFVAEQEEAGTPLTFWFEVEEYELDLTEEQKEVLQQLQELELFKGTNNIITAEDLALLQLKYIADTKSYIDKEIDNRVNEQLSNIQAQLLELQTEGN